MVPIHVQEDDKGGFVLPMSIYYHLVSRIFPRL